VAYSVIQYPYEVDDYPLISVRPLRTDKSMCFLPSSVESGRNAVYVVSNNQPFIISRVFKSHVDRESYDEIGWLLLEEVRMLSALNLASQEGHFSFLATEEPTVVKYTQLKQAVTSRRFRMADYIDQILQLAGLGAFDGITDTDKTMDNKLTASDYYNLIDPNHFVLMRILYLSIKATMLWHYRVFAQEATMLVYFGLDGIVKLLHEDLQSSSATRNIKDTLTYLAEHTATGEAYFEYLELCYDNRTQLVHPLNDIDYVWNPPLEADDFYETREILRQLCRFYLTAQWTEI